jgi:AraC-like DNA-binding protein
MAGGGTEILVRRPDPRLAGAVLGVYGYSETTNGPMRRRELPGTRVVMIIELGPAITILNGSSAERHPLGFVAGLSLAPVFTETVGYQCGVQVMFTALGAGRLLGIPIGALAGAVVGIEAVLGACGRDLASRLRDAPDWSARFALLEVWLLARAATARGLPPDLAFAVAALDRHGGALPIRGLARAAGCSERLLERRFAAELGLSPKRFARLARFEAAVARLSAGEGAAMVALDGGFVDQAHLVHEIRAFSGLSPGALLRARLPGEGGLAA